MKASIGRFNVSIQILTVQLTNRNFKKSFLKMLMNKMLKFQHCLSLVFLVSMFCVIEAEITLTPSTQNIAENNSVTLTCSYKGSLTVETYSMSVNSSSDTAGKLLTDCSVFVTAPDTSLYEYNCPTHKQLEWTIKKVTRANEGDTWRCFLGFTTSGSEEASFTINVKVPLQSVTMTSPTGSEVTVNENTETVFVCTTSGGLPAATVRWYKDQGTTVTSDDTEITSRATSSTGTSGDLIYVTSTLRYSPTRADNGMRVYCTATNSDAVFTSNRKPQLNVQYSPDRSPNIQGYNNGSLYKMIEGSQGSLSCTIIGGNPLATLTWSCYNAGSATVVDGSKVTKTVTWTASRDTDRPCTCQSSHPVAGIQSVSVNVQVLYSPNSPTFKVQGTIVSVPISFIEGKTRTVVCESKGKPDPDTYVWTKGGTTVRNGNTLTFNSVEKEDDGEYICVAQNTMIPASGAQQTGKNSSKVKITVLFVPSTPSLHYENINGASITRNSIDVVRGDSFKIACKSDGQPKPNFQWSGQTPDTQILTVTSIQDDQSRICTATSTLIDTYGVTQQGSASSTLTMNVLYPPSINTCKLQNDGGSPVDISGTIAVIEGRSFTLTCSATSKPAATLSWSGAVTSSSATLTVNNISKQQNGTYVVIAENNMVRSYGGNLAGRDTRNIMFDILYAPEIHDLSDKDIVAGSQFNISCPVIKGNPAPVTFKWTRNKDNMEWNKQILHIENITKHDDMIYTCTVKNTMNPTGASKEYGEDSGSFHLNVLYRASVISFAVEGFEGSASVTVGENDNIPFTCTVDSNPDSNMKVQFRGKTIYSKDNTKTLTYNHNNAACLDAGVYTCAAGNQYNYGTMSLMVLTLYVKCSPRPFSPVQVNVTSALRVPAKLDFKGLAYPVPDSSGFIWKKKDGNNWKTLTNSSHLIITISGMNTSLNFAKMSQSDYGDYLLVITNEVDTYSESFRLIAEGVPETPEGFIYLQESTTQTSALLQWIPTFNGGPDQTFVLMYKKTSEHTWGLVEIKDTGDDVMNYTLAKLASGTEYEVVVYAKNRIGNSTGQRKTKFSTLVKLETPTDMSPIIGGAAGGGSLLVLIIVTAAVFVLYRRGFFTKGKRSAHDDKNDRKPVYTDENDYGMQDNPMYVSAGPRNQQQMMGPGASGDADVTYSEVDKKKLVVESSNSGLYAEVVKPKKTKANTDHPEVEYTSPVKPKAGKKEKKAKGKTGLLKGKKEKESMQEGELYVNSTKQKNDETIYEIPELAKQTEKKNVNKDGLIYADLTFNDQPKGQKKLVIHGLDSMTEYVEVDFTKKADPLPDSDDENNSPKN